MILEGIVTTTDDDGVVNIAPMGPEVDTADPSRLVLKPFKSSRTYQNLARHGEGVFHVTDDVLLLARATINAFSSAAPPLVDAASVRAKRLSDCCRFMEFRVDSIDASNDRSRIDCRIVHQGEVRPFFGLSRAKHAVVEAAILVSRLGILPEEVISSELDKLRTLVEKTGGEEERIAFQLLRDHARIHGESQESQSQREIRIQAPSRLHFGFLSTGEVAQRAYGGVGLMIREPAVEIVGRSTSPGADPKVIGQAGVSASVVTRVKTLRDRIVKSHKIPADAVPSLEVVSCPPEHVGLGVGTQLSLTVASIVRECARDIQTLEDPRRLTGRGKRSSIGIEGWQSGGFLIDLGKQGTTERGTVIQGPAFPAAWRVLVIRPPLEPGRHGFAEEEAIQTKVRVPLDVTRTLSEIVLLRLVPAVAEDDISSFGSALAQFNRIVGQCFAGVQGGLYADPMIEAMIDWLADQGAGGAQSSWGPTTFAVLESEDHARRIGHELAVRFGLSGEHWLVTAPSMTGSMRSR